MLKKVLFTATLLVIILALLILVTYNARGIFFHNIPWLIVAVVVIGIALGIFNSIRHNIQSQRLTYQADRHTLDSFMDHWGTVTGILILTVSGFFISGGYRRGFSTNLHFLGLIITLFFGTYFLANFFVSKKYNYLLPSIRDITSGSIKKYLFRIQWKETGKYLSSQKTSFLIFSLLGIGILVTGSIKVAAFYFSIPGQLTDTATQAHDILARILVLIILIHILFALITPFHRSLLRSFFIGKLKQKD